MTLKVVAFRSEKEYSAFRLHAFTSAYYASESNRDYIVMVAKRFGVAAHEYSHFVLKMAGLKLPTCFDEGLAEVFSTLHVGNAGYELGGDLPARSHVLEAHKRNLLTLSELFTKTEAAVGAEPRNEAELFYAESWVLMDLLTGSSDYAFGVRKVMAALNVGVTPEHAFASVYSKSLADVTHDLTRWLSNTHARREGALQPLKLKTPRLSLRSSLQRDDLMAQVALVSGRVEEAKLRYRELIDKNPENPDFQSALGSILLLEGKRDESLELWRAAISHNVQDAQLCYRYAILADDAGAPVEDIRAGLERALLLEPDFDDARYHLALLFYRTEDYASAVEQLHKMRVPKGERRYAYWIALASALIELKDGDAARDAALEAKEAAQNDSSRMEAQWLSSIAMTELTVQLSTDANGRSQVITTRIPHGTKDWNPFIEPSDQIRHVNARLTQVLCTKGKLTGFLLTSARGALAVDVVDPMRVRMRNGPEEFYCGPTQGADVTVDYAVTQSASQTINILRGLTFLP